MQQPVARLSVFGWLVRELTRQQSDVPFSLTMRRHVRYTESKQCHLMMSDLDAIAMVCF